ncbi:MAG: helix-turn-helix transcriptional regulator [Kofleriaceae bacterium]
MPARLVLVNPGTRQDRILGPKLTAKRRAALGEFLRDRREKLAPARVGLQAHGRRRTPGLRREEVAQLSGVSVAWYTWLEQGREINPSQQALDAITTALNLTTDERMHVFVLAGHAAPTAPPEPLPAAAPPQVQAVLDAFAYPAYVSDRAWNIVGWNRHADQIFGYSRRDPKDRNTLVIAFGDPTFRALLVNANDESAALVANFRRSIEELPDDPAIDRVVERLLAYPDFKKLWERHEVKRRHFSKKVLQHPTLGRLVFETQSYQSAPFGLRLVLYVPDAATKIALGSRHERQGHRHHRR